MDSGDGRHRRGLEKIAANPEAFGLGHPQKIALEITLSENGRAVTETDIRLVMANGDLHLVEYKIHNNNKYRQRAKRQLAKAKKWHEHNGVDPENIYTHIIFGDDPQYLPFFRQS